MKKKNDENISFAEVQKRLEGMFTYSSSRQEKVDDSRFMEREEGPTPSGGDYSIAYFYDAEHKPCEKESAVYINIIEFTKNGVRVNETYLVSGEKAK